MQKFMMVPNFHIRQKLKTIVYQNFGEEIQENQSRFLSLRKITHRKNLKIILEHILNQKKEQFL